MSYTPTEWESTDVVTATRMNALEQAVGDMNMSYTPNTWSDGDILSAEKMNALEQAVASGGSGSSDFSTAQVTIVSNVGGIVYLPATMDEGGASGLLCYGLTDAGDYDIVLYKGMCVGSVTADGQNTVTTTGDIVNNSGTLLVTGDGTITIS